MFYTWCVGPREKSSIRIWFPNPCNDRWNVLLKKIQVLKLIFIIANSQVAFHLLLLSYNSSITIFLMFPLLTSCSFLFLVKRLETCCRQSRYNFWRPQTGFEPMISTQMINWTIMQKVFPIKNKTKLITKSSRGGWVGWCVNQLLIQCSRLGVQVWAHPFWN